MGPWWSDVTPLLSLLELLSSEVVLMACQTGTVLGTLEGVVEQISQVSRPRPLWQKTVLLPVWMSGAFLLSISAKTEESERSRCHGYGRVLLPVQVEEGWMVE